MNKGTTFTYTLRVENFEGLNFHVFRFPQKSAPPRIINAFFKFDGTIENSEINPPQKFLLLQYMNLL